MLGKILSAGFKTFRLTIPCLDMPDYLRSAWSWPLLQATGRLLPEWKAALAEATTSPDIPDICKASAWSLGLKG